MSEGKSNHRVRRNRRNAPPGSFGGPAVPGWIPDEFILDVPVGTTVEVVFKGQIAVGPISGDAEVLPLDEGMAELNAEGIEVIIETDPIPEVSLFENGANGWRLVIGPNPAVVSASLINIKVPQFQRSLSRSAGVPFLGAIMLNKLIPA